MLRSDNEVFVPKIKWNIQKETDRQSLFIEAATFQAQKLFWQKLSLISASTQQLLEKTVQCSAVDLKMIYLFEQESKEKEKYNPRLS